MTAYYSRDGVWRVQQIRGVRPGSSIVTSFLRVSKSTSDGLAFQGDGKHRMGPVYLGGGWYLAADCLTCEEVAKWVDLAELEEGEP